MDRAGELRYLMQRLFRLFGALSDDTTPCGKPLSMAHAHALQLLLLGERTQQGLGAELHIDKSNVARLCAKMVQMGHVSQAPAAHDKRSRLVKLTSKGERLANEVAAASQRKFRDVLSAIPADRRGMAIDGLRDIVASLDNPKEQSK